MSYTGFYLVKAQCDFPRCTNERIWQGQGDSPYFNPEGVYWGGGYVRFPQSVKDERWEEHTIFGMKLLVCPACCAAFRNALNCGDALDALGQQDESPLLALAPKTKEPRT